MTVPRLSRRTALSTLGVAGVALLAEPLMGSVDAQTSIVSALSEASRQQLASLQRDPGFSGVIRAADAKALADRDHMTNDQLMMALLPAASTYSRAPISNFHVGAVARGESGDLYFGANLEVPGQPLSASVHAEQSAIANAYMHGDKGISAIAVNYAPCGHCRQFMNELSVSGDLDIFVSKEQPTKLSILLPHSFGPKDLGARSGVFPPQSNGKFVTASSSGPLATAALDAARAAYAPHSGSPSGVAIQTRSKKVFKGSYIENAAYNPSLSPTQTALSALVLANGDFADIEAVHLVELRGAKISQQNATRVVLAALAPNAKITVD